MKSRQLDYQSCLADHMSRFVAHKRALGRRFDVEQKTLRPLDRFLVDQRHDRGRCPVVAIICSAPYGACSTGWSSRISLPTPLYRPDRAARRGGGFRFCLISRLHAVY